MNTSWCQIYSCKYGNTVTVPRPISQRGIENCCIIVMPVWVHCIQLLCLSGFTVYNCYVCLGSLYTIGLCKWNLLCWMIWFKGTKIVENSPIFMYRGNLLYAVRLNSFKVGDARTKGWMLMKGTFLKISFC